MVGNDSGNRIIYFVSSDVNFYARLPMLEIRLGFAVIESPDLHSEA